MLAKKIFVNTARRKFDETKNLQTARLIKKIKAKRKLSNKMNPFEHLLATINYNI